MLVNKELISKILTLFLAIAQKDQNRFDPRDVEMVKADTWWVERFALVSKNQDEALKGLIDSMESRKSYGVNDLNYNSFPKELHELNLFTTNEKDKDKQGRRILWAHLVKYTVSDTTRMVKQFCVYHFERVDRYTSNEGWLVIADSTGVTLPNVNLDWKLFFMQTLEKYYPRGVKYLMAPDVPLILMATANAVIAFSNQETSNRIKIMTKEELRQYLDDEQIPDGIKVKPGENVATKLLGFVTG